MNVGVQASANMTHPQLHMHTNMIVIRDDVQLYDAYFAYWNDLDAHVQNANYYQSVDGATGTKVYFFPRSSGDTVVSVLGNVECVAGSKIRVAMAFFSDARVEIANQLVALKSQGCSVEAVLKDDATNPGATVLSTLKNGGVTVKLFPDGPNDECVH